MATRLISPGVFSRENDLSFLPQGIAEIGAAFVGPTLKGPAFRPVIVSSQDEFTARFGGTTPDFYTTYAIRSYLKESNRATVVRVLGLSGYAPAAAVSAVVTITSASVSYPIGLIHPSRLGTSLTAVSLSGSALSNNFNLVLTGSSGVQSLLTGLSVNPASANYFGKALGSSPSSKNAGYSYVEFPRAASFMSGAFAGSASISIALATTQLNLSGSVFGVYSHAATPMIRSQLIGGSRYDLFKFHMLSDGNASNTDVKVSVASIRPNPLGTGYGTFSVLVRSFGDTDSKLTVLEQYDNVTLDPDSANYVARRIGTARPVIDVNGNAYLEGEYPSLSQYVYIEMATGATDVPADCLPYGFAALATPINAANVPAPVYVSSRYTIPVGATTAVGNNKIYYGIDFNNDTSLAYFNPTPSGSINAAGSTLVVGVTPAGADTGFFLDTLTGADATDIAVIANLGIRKFTVPFQGGFDGFNPAVTRNTGEAILPTNTMGFDLSDSSRDGARAYTLALGTVANPDAFDINMLVLPGVIYNLHPFVAQQGIDLCESRGDCFYIMDADVLGASVASVVNTVSGLDTNYAAVYFPWIKVLDVDTNKNVWVPPSAIMPSVYAFNDRVGAEWFAPAGLSRGGISEALQVRTRVDQASRDTLYEGRVNPIAQFPAQGIAVWGQKTLQQRSSALDRINVRRLLITVKKFIASSSRYLVFEQNVDATRRRFLNIANPYLASIQERSGIFAFRVIMDESNNTPDVIDRNILVGQIYLQPARSAEFITLDFNVLPTGAVFPE